MICFVFYSAQKKTLYSSSQRMKLAYFAQDKDLLSPHVMQTRN